ncbi:DUF4124 domain-containing protein [Hahella sp. CCB-MM4]|uniref:DUF4124 domain-containing protein n=1 Tax=Hahella sp. (strain CCB-MM4) TaxID=1926491 RepID=UPI000B9B83EF|nr:DUF4124 domain-containing protein [Hahella sp. CCB-MM4]OZG71486.1 DUF4124 domain-containing protein [Hahella sp. CCB-MM4]
MRTTITAIVLLGMCLPAYSAGVYKWTDEDGVVHYSDKKPGNQDTTQLNVRAGKTSGNRQSVDEQTQQLDDKEELEKIRKQQEEENAAAEKLKEDRCHSARTNMETLTTKARIRIKDADGKERFLTPEEILEKRKESQTVLDEECQ